MLARGPGEDGVESESEVEVESFCNFSRVAGEMKDSWLMLVFGDFFRAELVGAGGGGVGEVEEPVTFDAVLVVSIKMGFETGLGFGWDFEPAVGGGPEDFLLGFIFLLL